MVVALAAFAGAELLVADVFAALAHLVIFAVKDDVLQQFAIQATVVQSILYRRLQADFEVLFLVVADEPGVVAPEGVLEFETQVTVELVDVLHVQALAIGRVGDERAAFGHEFYLVDVAALQFDVFVQACVFDVGAGDGNGLALDVAAVNLVGEFPFGTVVVIDFIEQFLVIVGPLLEGVVVAIYAGGDVGADEGCLDQERARAAHGVNQVGLAVPTAQQDDAGRQHLVDRGLGLRYAPTALEQRFTAAVERHGHFAARDVDVKTDLRIGQADAGTLAVFIIEEVGNGILDTIGDETRVVKVLAVDSGVDGKCGVNGHQLFPVERLQLLIQVVGTRRFEGDERFENAYCRAAGKICPIEHLFVSLEVNHAVSFGHLLGAQGAQLVGKDSFQSEEGLGHHVKFVSHHVLILLVLQR